MKGGEAAVESDLSQIIARLAFDALRFEPDA